MKRIILPVLVAAMAVMTGCNYLENKDFKTAEVTFEDINLEEKGYIASIPYSSEGGVITFANSYNSEFGNYEGFAFSKLNDMETPGYANQFSVYASSGFNSSPNFAVYYYSTFASQLEGKKLIFSEKVRVNLDYMYVNNTTYAALEMKNGSDFCKKFEDGDWFLLTVEATCANGDKKSVEFYLADFRDGKSYICDEWTKVDLSSLKDVLTVDFILSSSDNGEYGMNTPAYFCMDNLKFRYREY